MVSFFDRYAIVQQHGCEQYLEIAAFGCMHGAGVVPHPLQVSEIVGAVVRGFECMPNQR